MKKTLLVSLCIGLGVLTLHAQQPNHDNLRHFYDFEMDDLAWDLVSGADGWIDLEAGVPNTATIQGGTLNLDSTGFLTLPADTIAINTYPALTVEIWATPNAAENAGDALMLWSFGRFGNPGFYYLFFTPQRWDNQFAARMSVSPTQPWAHEQGPVGNANIGDAALRHYVVTLTEDSVMSIYVDGVLLQYDVEGAMVPAVDTLTGGHFLDSVAIDNAFIGRSMYSADANWAGTVDLFSIWNAALTANEVAWLFAQGSKRVLPEEPPVSVSARNLPAIRAYVANNHLYVDAEGATNLSVAVYNMVGAKVFQANEFRNGQWLNLSPGLYVVKVRGNGLQAAQKIIIR